MTLLSLVLTAVLTALGPTSAATPGDQVIVTGRLAGGPVEGRVVIEHRTSPCGWSTVVPGELHAAPIRPDGRFAVRVPADVPSVLRIVVSGRAEVERWLEPLAHSTDFGTIEQLPSEVHKSRNLEEPRVARSPGRADGASMLEGRVVSQNNRIPLPEVWVWFQDDPACHVQTDERGGFSLRRPGGRKPNPSLVVSKKGYRRAVVEHLDLREDEPVILEVRDGAVGGRVLTPAGRPIPWATIQGWNGEQTITDEAGRFLLSGLVQGHRGSLVVSAEGFGTEHFSMTAGALDSVPPASGDLEHLILSPTRMVSGRAVDPKGHAVAGASVVLFRGYVRIGEGVTDEDGRFFVERVPAGQVVLSISAPGHAEVSKEVRTPRQSREVDFGRLELPWERRMEGRVIDSHGAGVSGVEIYVSRVHSPQEQRSEGRPRRTPDAVTDPAGWFELARLSAGDLPIELWKEGFAPLRARIEVPAHDPANPTELVLHAVRPLELRVIDDEAAPVEGAVVLVTPLDGKGEPMSPRFSLRTDGAGRASTSRVEAGSESVHVVVRHDDYGMREAEITLPRHGLTEPTTVRLTAGARISGTVASPDGEPLAGVEIFISRGRTGGETMVGTTDRAGRYQLDNLDAGMLRLRYSHPTYESERIALQTSSGTDHRRDVVLGRLESRTIEGQVLYRDGEPAAGLGLSLRGGLGSTVAWGWTAEDGTFSLDEVPIGSYEISVSDPEYLPTADDLVLHVTESTRSVTLTVAPPCRVVGFVAGGASNRSADAAVLATDGSHEILLPLDAEGRMFEGRLPVGQWWLETIIEDGAHAIETVHCEPGAAVTTMLMP